MFGKLWNVFGLSCRAYLLMSPSCSNNCFSQLNLILLSSDASKRITIGSASHGFMHIIWFMLDEVKQSFEELIEGARPDIGEA